MGLHRRLLCSEREQMTDAAAELDTRRRECAKFRSELVQLALEYGRVPIVPTFRAVSERSILSTVNSACIGVNHLPAPRTINISCSQLLQTFNCSGDGMTLAERKSRWLRIKHQLQIS